jgi:hypothetical protein
VHSAQTDRAAAAAVLLLCAAADADDCCCMLLAEHLAVPAELSSATACQAVVL